MEVRAIAKYVRVQPRKVRIIADEVRGKEAVHTASLLRYHRSKSAQALRKVLVSAMANAQENHGISPEQLRIAGITVDEGPRLKRLRARAMGRGNRIIKKTSHITVVVEDFEKEKAVRPHGTKAKPRPTFAVAKKKSAPVAAAPVVEEEIVEAPVEAVEEAEVEVMTPVEGSTTDESQENQ
jgi:large subunit ribosomal protein L22